MSSYLYENRSSKYKHFNECEWNLKNAFSYDDRKGFSDLKIFTIQNNYRFSEMNDKYVQISVWTTNATGSFKGISALKNVFGIPKSVFWTKVIQGILLI